MNNFLNCLETKCTANVFAVNFTGFPCVPLKPCKVQIIIPENRVTHNSLQSFFPNPFEIAHKFSQLLNYISENFNENIYEFQQDFL